MEQLKELTIKLEAPQNIISRANKTDVSHSYRSDFMRDRDRILYSKAYRRLSGKTQVFITSFDDHSRTRLTHTLEVAQIARTISSCLGLNGDLTEAIALGHDLGHTPFGHVGERTLNYIMNGCDYYSKNMETEKKGFKHNLQSVRVASQLEQGIYPNFGLNLTNFTLYGFYSHSKVEWNVKKDGTFKPCAYFYKQKFPKIPNPTCNLSPHASACEKEGNHILNFYDNQISNFMKQPGSDEFAWSFEAQVVGMADEIAQRHHDLEDGLEAGIINRKEIIEIFANCFTPLVNETNSKNFNDLETNRETVFFQPMMSRFIVDLLVDELIQSSINNLNAFCDKYNLKEYNDFLKIYPTLNPYEKDVKIYPTLNPNNIGGLIDFDDNFKNKQKILEETLHSRILNSYDVQRMDGKGAYIIRRLFKAYVTNPQQLPNKTIISLYKMCSPKNALELDLCNINKNSKVIGILRDELEHKRNQISTDSKFSTDLLRVICDYIAGMTDSYAIKEYDKLYG
jgi:dGTPase